MSHHITVTCPLCGSEVVFTVQPADRSVGILSGYPEDTQHITPDGDSCDLPESVTDREIDAMMDAAEDGPYDTLEEKYD
jgi:hypothetical protein